MADPSNKNRGALSNSNLRSVITLALLIHLFIVFVAISANYLPSPLQRVLLEKLSPYAQPLNLKLSDQFSHKLYHYHSGEPSEDDHFVEIEFQAGRRAGEVIRLPDDQWPGTACRNRYRAFSHMLGFYAHQQQDDLLSRFLQAIAAHYIEDDTEARAVVRVRRHMYVPIDATDVSIRRPTDPNAPIYFQNLYQANVAVDSQGAVYLTKLEDAQQVAPLRNEEGAEQ